MFNFTPREMHVRIMQFTLLTSPKIKEFDDINVGEKVRKKEPQYIIDRSVNWTIL